MQAEAVGMTTATTLTRVGMDIGQMKSMKYETDVLLRGLVLVDKI